MPSKRVVVHTSCTACGLEVPLDGLVTNVTCGECGWDGRLDPSDFRWVLELPARVTSLERVAGETRNAPAACACGAPFSEAVLLAAWSERATSVSCGACARRTPFHALDGIFSSTKSAVVAAGSARIGTAPPMDLPCTNCGAPVHADGTTRVPVCTYCGAKNTLPAETWRALNPPGRAYPFWVWTEKSADVPRPPGFPVRTVLLAGTIGVLAIAGLVAFVATRPRPSGLGVVNGPCNGNVWACSTDGKAQLRCQDGKLVVALSCKGPKGCRLAHDGTQASCDYTYADPGDPCNVVDDACATDHKSMVHCDGSVFAVSATCKGPDGCLITPHDEGATLSCDDHVADPGDLCKYDDMACSPDRKGTLVCKDGRFVPADTCKGPDGCTISKDRAAGTTTIGCDGRIADVGDVCTPGNACSSDHHSLLKCERAHYAVQARCARGCTLSGERQLECR